MAGLEPARCCHRGATPLKKVACGKFLAQSGRKCFYIFGLVPTGIKSKGPKIPHKKTSYNNSLWCNDKRLNLTHFWFQYFIFYNSNWLLFFVQLFVVVFQFCLTLIYFVFLGLISPLTISLPLSFVLLDAIVSFHNLTILFFVVY